MHTLPGSQAKKQTHSHPGLTLIAVAALWQWLCSKAAAWRDDLYLLDIRGEPHASHIEDSYAILYMLQDEKYAYELDTLPR
jgi:hypothetical protein